MLNLPVTYKLHSFGVRQFRSIKDYTGEISVSGVHSPSSPLALIGVNESGKSNILKALSLITSLDYNDNRDRPLHYGRDADLKEFPVWAQFEYTAKGYGKGTIKWLLNRGSNECHYVSDSKMEKNEDLKQLLFKHRPNFVLIEELSPFQDYVLLESSGDGNMQKAQDEMLKLFQVFEPEISLDDIAKMFSESDSNEFQKGKRILSDLQLALSNAIREIWGVAVDIEIEPNARQLSIMVKDNRSKNADNDIRYPVFLSERSAGFRWLFAWAVAFVISKKEKENTVFLFDEPAIHLHPTAQEKFRDKIIELSKGCAGVVYSTHLPYIVNIENIQNNYIVYREGAASKVEKINATVAKEARLVLDRALGISNKEMLSLYAHRNCIIVGSEKARMLMHHIEKKANFDFPEIISIERQRFMPSLAEMIQMERQSQSIKDKQTICLFEVDDESAVEGYKKLLLKSKAGVGLTLSEFFNFKDDRLCVVEDILPKDQLSEFLEDEDVSKASRIGKKENKNISITKILSTEELVRAKSAVTLDKYKDMLVSATMNQSIAAVLRGILGI